MVGRERMTALDWQDSAACIGLGHLFYPTGSDWLPHHARESAAKAVCDDCPVLTECRDWALTLADSWAILGGLRPDERKKLRTKRSVSS